jgi:hypothetical protein
MRIAKMTAVALASTAMMTSGLAAAQTRAASMIPAASAKAPIAGVRNATRLKRQSGQGPVEGGAVAAGTPTGTIVVVGGLALVAIGAGIWVAADSDDDSDTVG